MAAPDPPGVSPEVRARLSILIVEDDLTLGEACASTLRAGGYRVTVSGKGDEALEVLKRRAWDIILLDWYMTPVSGKNILKAALDTNRGTVVIAISGDPSVTASTEALCAGAWDYLPKPFSLIHLQVLIGRASLAAMAAREARELRLQRAEQQDRDRITLLGVSPAIRRAIDLARKVAPIRAPVMISGEPGTGKSLLARFIHLQSRQANGEFAAVNCAELPEQLLASEIFGHRRGAFAGAKSDRAGVLETAGGGTVFLEELTAMPQPLQGRLLRALQSGEVRRLGSEQPDAVLNVRLISATTRDPREAVDAGVLRRDLFYRLAVVPLTLPPLAHRPEDIPILAICFLSDYWERYRGAEGPAPKLTDASLDLLRSRPWRGNVGELQNVIERLAVLAEPDGRIQPEDIPLSDEPIRALADGCLAPAIVDDVYHRAKDKLVAQFERVYLTQLVDRAKGNIAKAARLASIDRATLYRLIDKHGLRRDELT